MKYRNIIILLVIYILSFGLVFYLSKLYLNSNSVDESSITDYVFDVSGKNYDVLYNNIVSYSKENGNFILYVSIGKDSSFNDLLKDSIVDKKYKKKVLYFDYGIINNVSLFNSLLNSFCDNCSNVSLKDLPLFVCFKNQHIDKIVSSKYLNNERLLDLLEEYYD